LRDIPPGLGVQLNPKPDGLEFSFSGTDVQLADTPCQQA